MARGGGERGRERREVKPFFVFLSLAFLFRLVPPYSINIIINNNNNKTFPLCSLFF